jgi:uncharacterized protein YyaL (SSP411 family)/thiol-disulfide isomerase/thioredoxin/sugar lactone lactonase YvrE
VPNRLATEKSPYLRQHGDNPVDWYPWGDEALNRAKAEDKPILLSIGYSACHWCHVMERESFSDPDVAAAMNASFVNIKVDREERPDLDDVYMQAVQAFSGGHGGWPMTVLLTPDGRPFLGGTYFPPEPRQGLPSFRQLLEHARRVYAEQRDAVTRTADRVVDLLKQQTTAPVGGAAVTDWLDWVAGAADDAFDADHGGFGTAPKFPSHGLLAALVGHYRRTGRARTLDVLTATLDGMSRGAVYDLLGGGFCRYSVDAEWRVPHFEKMLGDNALLAPIYADVGAITGNARYTRIARETLDYVLTDLGLPDGAFAASEDADSGGHEGAFYAWTPEEVCEVLGFDDGIQLCLLLGLTQHGTFERGTSVLRTATFPEDLPADKRALYDRGIDALRQRRALRERPGKDPKVVAAWNGLAISAFARVGALLDEPRYTDAARRAAAYLLDVATVDGRLARTVTDGVRGAPAFAEDVAAVGVGMLDLYEATFEARWLDAAAQCADQLVALFLDETDGALFFVGKDATAPVVRNKRLIGGSEPSGNELAAWLFVRLGALLGRDDLRKRAEKLLVALEPLARRAPRAFGPAALASSFFQGPTREIGVVGEGWPGLVSVARRRVDPFRVLAAGASASALAKLPWMAHKTAADGKATAYVCEGYTCKVPVTTADELAAQLDAASKPQRASQVGGARVRAPALPLAREAWLNADAPIALESLRGRVVVLDFWTYCCINCLHVLPALDAVERRYDGRPVAVIGVHAAKFPAEQERENVELAVARHGVRHPVVLDPSHTLWDQYAVRSWPTVVVLDTQGRVAWHHAGEVVADELFAVIDRLLDEATEQGTAGAFAPYRVTPAPGAADLAFPGKVHVVPSFVEQAQGQDPFGPDARLYVADTGHHRILELALRRGPEGWPEAELKREFGTGEPGRADGPTATASFREPQGIARRGSTLYVADTGNHLVRAIDLDRGVVRTVLGSGQLGRSARINPAEPLTIDLRSPWDVTAASDVLFVAMAGAHQIWLYMEEPVRAGPFIGSGAEGKADGSPQEAALAQPSGIQVHGQYLFWLDAETSSLRLLDMSKREVGTVMGEDLFDFGDVDGEPDVARMQHPLGLTVAEATVYVADTFNHKIKAVDLADGGRVRTLAGGAGVLREPGGVAVAGAYLIVADTGNHRLRAVNRQTGQVRTILLKGFPE